VAYWSAKWVVGFHARSAALSLEKFPISTIGFEAGFASQGATHRSFRSWSQPSGDGRDQTSVPVVSRR